jgi:hypothetical protein
MTSGAGIAVLVALLAQVPPSGTEGGQPAGAGAARADDAEALILRGLDLREKRDDEGALRLFRRAFEIAGTGRALAQIALAEQALGRWPDAEADLTAALKRTDEAWIGEKKTLLEQSLAKIQGHLGSLELVGIVAGTELWIDGRRAGAQDLSRPLRLTAGPTAIELRAAGYRPILRTVQVPARGIAREQLAFVPAGAPPPALDHGGVRRTAGLILAGAGVVALGAGVAFHVTRESRAQAFNDAGCGELDGSAYGPIGCQGRLDGVQSARNLAIAGYVGAAVLGGVGAVLLLTSRSDQPARTSASLSRTVTCAPGVAGIVCAGQF